MDRILVTEKLNTGYGKKRVGTDINMGISPGEFLVILGPNGSGKSTFLRTVAGLLRPLGGSVLLEGEDVHKMKEEKRATLMSSLFTDRIRGVPVTVRQTVAMGRYPYTGWFGIPGSEDKEIIEQSMELAGVADLADELTEHLSDGQRQRVYIASAICQSPRIMLLDEPTSHLDIKYRMEILALLRRLSDEKKVAVMCCVHDPQVALSLCDKTLFLKNGRVFDGSLSELYDTDPGEWKAREEHFIDQIR